MCGSKAFQYFGNVRDDSAVSEFFFFFFFFFEVGNMTNCSERWDFELVWSSSSATRQICSKAYHFRSTWSCLNVKVLAINRGAESKYGIIFKTLFLIGLVQFLKKKKRYKSKFSWLVLSYLFFFLIIIKPNMCKQEMNQRIFHLLNA